MIQTEIYKFDSYLKNKTEEKTNYATELIVVSFPFYQVKEIQDVPKNEDFQKHSID